MNSPRSRGGRSCRGALKGWLDAGSSGRELRQTPGRSGDAGGPGGEIANIECKKGCGFCCTQMVAVTIPEVLRLADHIRSTWSEEERAALDLRMASYMKATEAWHNGDRSRKPRHVCPLLNHDEG